MSKILPNQQVVSPELGLDIQFFRESRTLPPDGERGSVEVATNNGSITISGRWDRLIKFLPVVQEEFDRQKAEYEKEKVNDQRAN